MLASSELTNKNHQKHISSCLSFDVATYSIHENIRFDIPSLNKVHKDFGWKSSDCLWKSTIITDICYNECFMNEYVRLTVLLHCIWCNINHLCSLNHTWTDFAVFWWPHADHSLDHCIVFNLFVSWIVMRSCLLMIMNAVHEKYTLIFIEIQKQNKIFNIDVCIQLHYKYYSYSTCISSELI